LAGRNLFDARRQRPGELPRRPDASVVAIATAQRYRGIRGDARGLAEFAVSCLVAGDQLGAILRPGRPRARKRPRRTNASFAEFLRVQGVAQQPPRAAGGEPDASRNGRQTTAADVLVAAFERRREGPRRAGAV